MYRTESADGLEEICMDACRDVSSPRAFSYFHPFDWRYACRCSGCCFISSHAFCLMYEKFFCDIAAKISPKKFFPPITFSSALQISFLFC